MRPLLAPRAGGSAAAGSPRHARHSLHRETAEKPPALEVGLRVKGLLDKLNTERRMPSPERIRILRAVETLERIGTAEACQVLKELAGGAAGAQRTQEVQATLARLAKRKILKENHHE